MIRPLLCILLMTSAMAHGSPASDKLLQELREQGAGPFTAQAGQVIWTTAYDSANGQPRACTDCHGTNLRQAGEHLRTGKTIDPMDPMVNPERLTDYKKINKWLLRNCKWTLGRECSPQEQGDLLTFIRNTP